LDPLAVVVLAVLLLSTVWCIPHLRVRCADLNSSSIGANSHNTNNGSSSRNRSSSTVLLPHCHSRLQSDHRSSLSPIAFLASTVERWGTLLANAASPSKAIHRKLRHSWSISRGANRGVLHHGLAVPTTPPWRRSPREKKC
jgi:hypothetical protein